MAICYESFLKRIYNFFKKTALSFCCLVVVISLIFLFFFGLFVSNNLYFASAFEFRELDWLFLGFLSRFFVKVKLSIVFDYYDYHAGGIFKNFLRYLQILISKN